MDYSCCAILCSIFVRDNPSPHSSKRLVKEKTPWKKQYIIVRKHDTIKGWNKWWSDNTTSTSTRKRIIVLAYQVDCSFFLSFRFPSNIHSQGIISLNRDDPLVYPQQLPIPGMDSLEQSGHGTRSMWCVANGRICYSVLFYSANGDDYGICVTIVHNWVHFGECIVKPIME